MRLFAEKSRIPSIIYCTSQGCTVDNADPMPALDTPLLGTKNGD